MPDRRTPAARSALMAKVRGCGNTTTEGALAQVFRLKGYVGWRRQRTLRGWRRDGEPWRVRPDFVFLAARFAVFVDGCFWHGCPRLGTLPEGRRAFWLRKFQRNRERDRRNSRDLRAAGWRVVRLWEHELKGKARPALLRKLSRLWATPAGSANKKARRVPGLGTKVL
jgi:DNA mismatch endonuclease (patch repair protein)